MTNKDETAKLEGVGSTVVLARDAALKAAVEAIYFNDSSDYETALWCVVKILGGDEAVELLERDVYAAFQKYVAKNQVHRASIEDAKRC